MTDANNNTDRLIQRITAAAASEADAILKRAREECEKTALIAEDEIFSIEKGAAARMERDRQEILERSATSAALDARKYALKAKRRLLDEAFAQAQETLAALAGEKREALLDKLLLGQAEGGEAVLMAAADAERLQRLIPVFNEKLRAAGKAALTPGEVAADIAAGFVLRAPGYEKNCSFEALIRDARAQCEGEVAAALFD